MAAAAPTARPSIASTASRVPPEHPSYTLRRVWLSEEEQDGYYYGFANEGLWPLCHIASCGPLSRERLGSIQAVNAQFAEAVVGRRRRRIRSSWCRTITSRCCPSMIRERLPEATIITFWHIPWPNPETFGICPWKEEILDGLLGSSASSASTRSSTATISSIPSTASWRAVSIASSRRSRSAASRRMCGPIRSRSSGRRRAGGSEAACRSAARAVRERLGLAVDVRLGVGIERFDYTKGILDRMRAVDAACSTSSREWNGRFTFVQVAAPTRTSLPTYQRTCRPRPWRSPRRSTRATATACYRADPAHRAAPRAGRSLRAVPGRRSLHRLEPA